MPMLKLPELPYKKDALAPHMSEETLNFHYGKHHKAYVDKFNELIQSSPLAKSSIDEVMKKAQGPLFNNAAQTWNHAFFWHCLTPKGSSAPRNELGEMINKTFGSFDEFKRQFTTQATTLFGSGWTWLVKTGDGKLQIEQTSNAQNPLNSGHTPLLTLDVWEHAYYIDYRNARAKFIEAFWNIANWDFAERNFNLHHGQSASEFLGIVAS